MRLTRGCRSPPLVSSVATQPPSWVQPLLDGNVPVDQVSSLIDVPPLDYCGEQRHRLDISPESYTFPSQS
jgi:hypothetical protein